MGYSVTNIFWRHTKYFCIAGREAERVLLVVHVVPDVSARRARGARDRVVPGARGVPRHRLHVQMCAAGQWPVSACGSRQSVESYKVILLSSPPLLLLHLN